MCNAHTHTLCPKVTVALCVGRLRPRRRRRRRLAAPSVACSTTAASLMLLPPLAAGRDPMPAHRHSCYSVHNTVVCQEGM